MDTNLIKQVHKKFTNNTLSFPDGIMQLIQAGVQFQYIDLIQLVTISYSVNNDYLIDNMVFDEKIYVESNFDIDIIQKAIRLSQEENLPFIEFCKMAAQAGCIGYHIFIYGKKVVYYGREGQSHIEFFPS